MTLREIEKLEPKISNILADARCSTNDKQIEYNIAKRAIEPLVGFGAALGELRKVEAYDIVRNELCIILDM